MHAAQAMLQYCAETREVQLVADRSYRRGEPIKAWCGPQPNRRLLLNYGIVTDDNPYDRLALTVTLPHADSLFQAKRGVLQQHKLATQQTFQLQRGKVPERSPSGTGNVTDDRATKTGCASTYLAGEELIERKTLL